MPPAAPQTVSNPLRPLGAARVLAGIWFLVSAAQTLLQFGPLFTQAQRLFYGEMGGTDAPIRSLLALIIAGLMIPIGLTLIVKGAKWLGRVPVVSSDVAPLLSGDVTSALVTHELLACSDGSTPVHGLLQRTIPDQLSELTAWRRAMMGRGVRAFIRALGTTALIAGVWTTVHFGITDDILGPFPFATVLTLPIVTMLWAALALMLISDSGRRVESVEFPLEVRSGERDAQPAERIIESPPGMVGREPAALGTTLGLLGVGTQCLMLAWWDLSTLSYPLLATSIVRHTLSIVGGILFFVLGGRIVNSAADLLLHFKYESIVVLVHGEGNSATVRAADVRSESHGLGGPRHLMSAVGGLHARERAEAMLRGS